MDHEHWDEDLGDMRCLYQAAIVLESRTRKPNGIMLRIFVKILRDSARDISQGKLPVLR